MKKIAIAIMSFACAVCAAAALSVNQKDVQAQEDLGIFTETKCQVSKNGDKLLIVTGIRDTSLIYEMGYELGDYVLTQDDVAEANKYYESLTLGTETQLASQFIEGAEGLLVWEIAYDPTVAYSVRPYAYVGELNDDEELIAPENNEKTYGALKENFNVFTVTFADEDGVELSDPQTLNYGQKLGDVAAPEKVGYTFDGWYNGESKVDVKKAVRGSMDLVAKYKPNENTAFTVKVYKEKLLGGGFDLVETVVGKGTTDDTATIEDVTITANVAGLVQTANSVTEGTIAGNGSLELSVYYAYPTVEMDFKTYQTYYSAATATLGTNANNTDTNASGVHFNTESNKVYFAGRYVYAQFQFQGFWISSGDVHRSIRPRAKGFEVIEMSITGADTIDADGDGNNKFIDARNGYTASNIIMNNYTYNIAGSGALKEFNFAIVIKNDILHLFYDEILCMVLDLKTVGFTANSNYDVGIARDCQARANPNYTVNSIVLRTGNAVDELFASFEQNVYTQSKSADWGTPAMATYMLDGSVVMQRQIVIDGISEGTSYNGVHTSFFKNSSDTIYYKSTLTIAKGEGLSFDSGIGFAIKSGDHKYGFNFGGSSLKEWLKLNAETSQFVVNSEKIAQITAKNTSEEDKVFEMEYIVSGNVLYLFVDGTLTVKIVLSELNAAFTAGTNYQIGILMRWPTVTHKVGYYAPTLVYGADAQAVISATGYTLN